LLTKYESKKYSGTAASIPSDVKQELHVMCSKRECLEQDKIWIPAFAEMTLKEVANTIYFP
tara:strand:+ start:548 stop:730 length:183 start_codon:yes stop_codon:yes gene_type:complete